MTVSLQFSGFRDFHSRLNFNDFGILPRMPLILNYDIVVFQIANLESILRFCFKIDIDYNF